MVYEIGMFSLGLPECVHAIGQYDRGFGRIGRTDRIGPLGRIARRSLETQTLPLEAGAAPSPRHTFFHMLVRTGAYPCILQRRAE